MLERDRRRKEKLRQAKRYAQRAARQRQAIYDECPNHGRTPYASPRHSLIAIQRNGYTELNCYEANCMGQWRTQTHLVHP